MSGPRSATGAAFFDLDRTLLKGASGPIIAEALREAGVITRGAFPGEKLLFGAFDLIGETLPSMALTRQGARAAKGWSVHKVREAAEVAADRLAEAVEPFAREAIRDHHDHGRLVVLATTTPFDLVAPLARRLGLDDVLATHYRVGDDGAYDGTIDGEFVWSRGKARVVKHWARARQIDLDDCFAYSDSVFDLPLLRSVGHPAAVNPDLRLLPIAVASRWPVLWFDAPPGVPRLLGLEPQRVATMLARAELLPWVRIRVEGLEHVPAGGALLAANHRSYLDPLAVGFAGGRLGRPVRFLAKKEVTDAPIVGPITTALGAIRVDREGPTEEARAAATAALRAGELVAIFPQGTIPRGHAFFDPELQGRNGAVKLAADADRPIVPVGIWGTERAWPRHKKVPYVMNLSEPPEVTIRFGEPCTPRPDSEGTAALMDRIVDLLPLEARRPYVPTDAELAATFPDGVIPGSGG